MKSAIKQILSGDTCCENIAMPSETEKTSLEAVKMYEELKETLNEKQVELLDKLLEIEIGIKVDMEEVYYKHGVKLGLQLGAEAFKD